METLENIKYYDLNEITVCCRFHANKSIVFWNDSHQRLASIVLQEEIEPQIMRLTSEGWSYATKDEIELLRAKYDELCQNK